MKSTESLVPHYDGTPRTTYEPKNRKRISFGAGGHHPDEVRREQLSNGALIRAIRSPGTATSFSTYGGIGCGWQSVNTRQLQQLHDEVQQFIAKVEPNLFTSDT